VALVRDDADRFSRLIADCAQTMGLDRTLVEKDYWAIEALRAVHQGFNIDIAGSSVHIQPIFKGGTSLSKAFGLIKRFSEDVDLLVPVPVGTDGGYSQQQRADVLKGTTEAVCDALGIPGARGGGRRGVDRHWLYPYDSRAGATRTSAVEPSIRIEVTAMGGENPRSLRAVTSMVAEHARTIAGFPSYADLVALGIVTLAPERTLVEKLAMLHDAAHQAAEGAPRRLETAGRHYYDIAMLLRDDNVRSRLNSDWVTKIAADADRWSARGGYPFTPRPDSGFAESPAFTSTQLSTVVQASFDAAMTWVWDERPTLEDCMAEVADNSELL